MKNLLALLFALVSVVLAAQPKVLQPSFDPFGDEITLSVTSTNPAVSYFDATITYYSALNDGCGSDASGGVPDISDIIRLNRVGSTDVFTGTGLYFPYHNVHIRIHFQGMDASGDPVSGETPDVYETDMLGLAGCYCFDNTIDELNTFLSSQTMQVGGGNTFVPFNAAAYPEYNQYYFVWSYPADWELIEYEGVRATFDVGNDPGEVSVRAVNPCSGAESVVVSYFAKADQSISFDPLAPVTFGGPDFDLTATASSGLPVTYTGFNSSIINITGSTVTIVGTGTTNITAQQVGDDTYNAAPIVQQNLTVNKADQTITFGSLSDIKYSDGPLDLTATSSSGLAVTYSSSDESIVVINSGQAHPVGVGTVTITASQAGNSNYNPAPDANQSLTVLKGDQTIDFSEIVGPFNVNQNTIPLSADASSTLTVTFSSSDESVVTISGFLGSIQGAGTTTITASQPGNSLFNAAPDVSQEVTVDKLSQTVTVPDLSGNNYTFGLNASPFQVYNSSGIDNMVFESSDESVFNIQNVSSAGGGFFFVTLGIVGAGSATFTATQPGDDTYELAMASSTVNVGKANQSITFFGPSPVFFGAPDFELSATANSGLPVTFSSSDPTVATVSGTTVTVVGGGVTTITASQSGNDNYNPASDVDHDFTVIPLTQTINFITDLPGNNVFGDGPFSFDATASSGLPVTFSVDDESVITVSGGIATIQGAGNATITATQAGNQNYQPGQGNFNVAVDLANQSISFDFLDPKQFDDASFDLTASSTSGLPVTYTSGNESVATISGSTVTIVGVGSTTITASQDGNSNYYAAGSVNRTLNVSKADQSITFDPINDLIVGEMILVEATASSGLPVDYAVSGPATLVGSQLTTTGLGTVTVTASQSGDANYNAASPVVQMFDVVPDKLSQTITFNPLANGTFGDGPFSLAATASSGLPVSYVSSNPGVATVSGSTVTIVGAGIATITASQAGDSDYFPADDVQQTLTVDQASQTITFDLGSNANKVFGDAPFPAPATASSGLPVMYSSSNTSVVSIDDGNIEINGPGMATITASQSGNSNYDAATPVEQVITVSKALQVITFDPAIISDQILSDGSVTFDVTVDTSFPLTVTIKSGPGTIENIGPDFYEVTFTGEGQIVVEATVGETANYQSGIQELSFNVIDDSKLAQTITFPSIAARTYGDTSFDLEATSTSGLGISYTSSDETVATVSGSTVTIVGAGSATITASQEGNGDYFAAESVDQVLEVNKASQVITFDPVSELTVDESYVLEASTTSSLPVDFTIEGPAELDGNTLVITAAGTITVTASQVGNENYLPAENVARNIVSAESEVLSIASSNELRTYPNPASGYLIIEGLAKPGLVRIYDLDGKLMLREFVGLEKKLKVSHLENGVYLMRIENSSHTEEIIIRH